MLSLIISSILFLLLLFSHNASALAEDFETYMKEWDDKRDLATKYLQKAEKSLKGGDKANGCINQKKAGIYGIEATEALIKAMKINGSKDALEGFESGLNKWKELRDFCE